MKKVTKKKHRGLGWTSLKSRVLSEFAGKVVDPDMVHKAIPRIDRSGKVIPQSFYLRKTVLRLFWKNPKNFVVVSGIKFKTYLVVNKG